MNLYIIQMFVKPMIANGPNEYIIESIRLEIIKYHDVLASVA